MLGALPVNSRAIVTNLEVEFLKKARGKLVAEGIADPPETIVDPLESIAIATIRDNSGDTVSVVRVTWLLSPKKEKETGDLRAY